MTRNTFLTTIATLALTACTGADVDYDASGVFEATEVTVSAQAQGELTEFTIAEGQTLTQGQTVGLIDTMLLSLQKAQLQATLSATDSKQLDLERQIAPTRQQLSNLRQERDRFATLLAEKAATQKQVDDIDYQIGVCERQLAALTEQVGSANKSLSGQKKGVIAQIRQVDQKIAQSIVASPISGTVLTKYMEQGEYAAPGKPLFKMADVENIKLRAYISASQLTQVKLGQEVTVYADYGTDGRKAYTGTLSWICDKAEFTPKTIQVRDERANLVYAVKVAVKNDGLIKIGMYGDVKF